VPNYLVAAAEAERVLVNQNAAFEVSDCGFTNLSLIPSSYGHSK